MVEKVKKKEETKGKPLDEIQEVSSMPGWTILLELVYRAHQIASLNLRNDDGLVSRRAAHELELIEKIITTLDKMGFRTSIDEDYIVEQEDKIGAEIYFDTPMFRRSKEDNGDGE